MNNLGQLPIEIIASIVNHITEPKDLSHYALINKSFYAATNPLLWRKLDMRLETTFIKCINGLLASSPQQHHQHHLGHHVRSLVFQSCSTNLMLLILMKQVPHLETLSIIYAKAITDQSFKMLPQHCPDLTTLTLRQVPISTMSMIALGQHCHHLRKLELEGCHHLSPAIFPYLASCPLTELTIYMDQGKPDWLMIDNNNSNNNNNNNNNNSVVEDLTLFTQLTKLTIMSWSKRFDLGARILQASTSWPHLTELVLKGCGYASGGGGGVSGGVAVVTSSQLTAFFQAHRTMDHLQLSDLKTHLIPIALTSAATFLPRLKHLVLGNPRTTRRRSMLINAKIVRHLIHQCPSLTYLDILNGKFLKIDLPTELRDAYGGIDDYDDENDDQERNVEGSHDGFLDGFLEKYSIDKIRAEPDPGRPDAFDENDLQQQHEQQQQQQQREDDDEEDEFDMDDEFDNMHEDEDSDDIDDSDDDGGLDLFRGW